MHEIADFLRGFPPFDRAEPEALDAVVGATQIEYFGPGDVLFTAGGINQGHAHVIRSGHVELLDGPRVIDVVGPGDVVGLPSLVSDLPPGLDVRAAQDVLTYRIPADALVPLLEGRSGLRFLARTIQSRTAPSPHPPLAETATETLGALARPAVVVDDAATIGQLVDRMHAADSSCAVVRMPGGELGIVTDHDLRHRVLARRMSLDAPAHTCATAPIQTAGAHVDSDVAVQTLLTHGIRHLVVLAGREVVGFVEDVDLLAVQSRTPVRLRRAIRRAASAAELVEVAAGIVPSALAAHRAGNPASAVTAGLSSLREAVVAKAIEVQLRERGLPPRPFAWVVTGSVARGETLPASDVDTLLAWDGPDDEPETKRWMRAFASDVLATLSTCGVMPDDNGMRADDARFSRSIDAWRSSIRDWAQDPMSDQADIYLAALLDARPSWGHATWAPVREQVDAAFARPRARTMLHRAATGIHPPTGFVRDLVIEGSGEHAGTLDLKGGGAGPIVAAARYVSVLVPGTHVGTLGRLRAAATRSIIGPREADDLSDAFDVVQSQRLRHQAARIERGIDPDDRLRPDELSTLERRHLRDAFRLVRRAQQLLPSPVARP